MQTRRLLERGSVAERIAKGQAEKAQKAEAALRAEDSQRCAENGPALGLALCWTTITSLVSILWRSSEPRSA